MPQHIEPNETREHYLERAKDWAKAEYYHRVDNTSDRFTFTFNQMRIRALERCQAEFPDLGTHGVEHIQRGPNPVCRNSPEVFYLNTGDTYGRTVLVRGGRWEVGDWGSIVENGNYNRD